MPFVIDKGSALGKVERTPQGGARVPATLARTGVMTYYVDGKPVRHYNPPEVLEAALESAAEAPVTHNHPRSRQVTADNFAAESRGHVSPKGLTFDRATGHLRGHLIIQDADLLADIEAGRARQVSMGYDIECDASPGVTPEGEPYDVVRTKIVYNHAAVVPEGRAGGSVRLLLDSSGQSILDEEEIHMKIVVDGVEIAPEKVQGVVDGLNAQVVGLRSQVETLKADAATFDKRVADAAQKLYEKRVADEAQAKAAEEAKVALEAKRTKAKAAFPKLALDSATSEYLDGLLATVTDAAPKGTEAPDPEKQFADASGKGGADTANDSVEVSPREFVRRQNAARWANGAPDIA